MIYQTVNFSMFCDAFRSLRPDNFSYEGLQALYNYLEDMADSTGEPIELDVIALCCDYAEATIWDIAENYGIKGTDEEILDAIDDHLVYETEAGTWIYQPW